ncbi:Calcium-binding protein NCSA [Diplonema papillatum]|nr:Calcium-binding protein NCSA [Diplonema papillatum]
MGNTLPKTLSKQELQMLQASTVFTKDQIEELYHHFRELSHGGDSISLKDLKEVLVKRGVTFDDLFIESLFYAFDTESRGKINLQQFCSGLSIITKNNTDEDKLQLIFSMYDQAGRDAVSREDLVNAFHSMRRAFDGIRLDKDRGEPENSDDRAGIVKYVNEVFEKVIEIRKDSPGDAIHQAWVSSLAVNFI